MNTAGSYPSPGREGSRATLLHGLLLLTVTVPALVFLWGRDHGEIAFVLYREPKLVALSISLFANRYLGEEQ